MGRKMCEISVKSGSASCEGQYLRPAEHVPRIYLYRPRVGCLHQHKGHGWAQQNDMRVLEVYQVLPFQVSVVPSRQVSRSFCHIVRAPYSSQNAMTCVSGVSLVFCHTATAVDQHCLLTSHSSTQIYPLASLSRSQSWATEGEDGH